MIVLFSRADDPTISPELADLAPVTVFKPPRRRPEGQRAAPLWADRALAKIADLVAQTPVTAFVSDDDESAAFAYAVAERHPDIPVLSGQSLAARVIDLLQQRGQPVETTAVRDLLDGQRVPYPRLPQYLVDRRSRPPLVVSMVNNSVDVDSRVQKVARSLADLGYDSVLLGRSPKSEPEGDWYLIGDAVVLRVPVETTRLHEQLAAPPRGWTDAIVGAPDPSAAPRGRLRGRLQDLRVRRDDRNRASFAATDPTSKTHREQRRLVESGELAPDEAYPAVLDWADAFVPVLTELRPDVIHIHDPTLIPAAVKARGRLQRAGHSVALVYDAHEWTLGIARDHALQVPALAKLESDHMQEMAAVITVSQPLADRMQQHFSLPRSPAVVTNAPVAVTVPDDAPNIRGDLDLPDDVPLLVYTGAVAAKRGLDLALRALQRLPDAHLALISRNLAPTRQVLRDAREMGLAGRVHRLDYVPADEVAGYLRTADVGLIPFQVHENSDLGLPTKYREYLLAGLPIVATDTGLTGAEVTATGVGEVAPPDSPRGFAAAIDRVLADRDGYTRRITEAIRAENSWQRQEVELARAYASVAAASTPMPAPSGVLLGGLNSAGQGSAWAEALRRAGVPARSLELRTSANPFHHDVDVLLPRTGINSLERRTQVLLRELVPSQAIILESGQPIAAPEPGSPGGRRLAFREARALVAAGHQVGLMFHGSDLRRPDLHARTHPWSPFREPAFQEVTDELRKRTRWNHEQLASWEGPVMVSTPDLLRQNPAAVWVPVVVDVDAFAAPDRSAPQGPPVVLHLPSKSMMKGSHLIDPILQELAEQGVIRYRRATNVPHERVPGLLRESDIFVDQLGMGIMGVAAVEAMAAGVPVVTDPGPEALSAYGVDVPVVAVDPDSLAAQIRSLATDPDRWRQLSGAGPAFARTFHDGSRSAAAIIDAMGLQPVDTL